MDILHLLCIVTITGLTRGSGVLPDGPLNATMGESQTFTTTLIPPEITFLTVTWNFGDKHIITSHVVNITDPEYEGRVTFFPSTAFLELKDLTEADNGEYSILLTPTTSALKQGTTTLRVYERVSSVSVSPSSADLVEFNSSIRLTCTPSGSHPSFLWLNDTSEVTESDRVQLLDGGAILNFINVTQYDRGPFRCRVFNPVSGATSDPVNFSINYGPENINLTQSPPQDYFEEGSNINLSCSAVSSPSAQYMWFLNGVELPDTAPKLILTDVQRNHSGNYSCQAFNHKTLRYVTSQTSSIFILAHVSNIVVTSNTTDLVEFNSSVSLSCSSSGSFLSFLWLNGSSEVAASDRVQLTDGGSTLTIVSVTRNDQGPFMCCVVNPVSHGTSDPINLPISYGPENINLTLSPSQEYFEEGSNANLSCSAVSRPAALFNWFLNGDLLTDTGPELRLVNIQLSQSGNYSCHVFNNKTLRYQTSHPSAVSVLEKISGASLKPSTNLPVEGMPVILTCDASGSVITRNWMKNGVHLVLDDNMMLSDNDRVLYFNPVNRKDSGKYFCKISNPLTSDGAEYDLIVNHGPDNVLITVESKLDVCNPIKLTCSAQSTPLASYTWLRDGSEILINSDRFFKDKANLDDSGEYICRARNNVTGRASSVVYALTVKDKLCDGAIAGIVIGCLVVIAAVAGGVWFYIHKNRKYAAKPSNRTTSITTGGEGQNNGAYSDEELNYANIRFNKNGGTVQLGLQNNSSNYAEVQVNNRPPAVSSPPTYDAHVQRVKRPAPQPSAHDAPSYAQVRKK